MSSCNNSSNLLGNVNINNITHSGARLMMTHPLSGFSGGAINQTGFQDGITAGDAIRYNAIDYDATSNPSGGKYVKAQADTAGNSEVVGVVESVEDIYTDGSAPENAVVNIVLSGQIKYPSDKLWDVTPEGYSSGASCGNDVYFLSGQTAGYVQNLAPTIATQIAKPILQKAADGVYTAHVVNYIGYQIGGEIVGTRTGGRSELGAEYTKVLNFGDSGITEKSSNSDLWDLSKTKQWLPINTDDKDWTPENGTYYTAYLDFMSQGKFGRRWKVVLDESPTISDNGRQVKKTNTDGTVAWEGKIVSMETNKNTIFVETTNIHDVRAGDTIYGRSGRYTVSSAYVTAMVLPYIQSKQVLESFVDLRGRKTTVREIPSMLVPRDVTDVDYGNPPPGTREVAISIPQEVEVKKLVVTDKATIKSEDNNLSGEDIINLIKIHDDEIQTLKDTLSLSKTSATGLGTKT